MTESWMTAADVTTRGRRGEVVEAGARRRRRARGPSSNSNGGIGAADRRNQSGPFDEVIE